jgi:hypothetical protein
MALVFDATRTGWAIVSVLAFVAAVLVWCLGASASRSARWLAALLAAESFQTLNKSWAVMMTDPRDMIALGRIGQASVTIASMLLLLFMGTLPVAAARPLRARPVRAALVAVAAAVFAILLVAPGLFGAFGIVTWLDRVLPPVNVPVAVYALVVAAALLRRHPPGHPQRRRDLALAAAFFCFDASLLLYASVVTLHGTLQIPVPASIRFAVFSVVTPLLVSLWILLLAYGILRAHLFDIDVKVRAGIARATLASVFVVAFVVGEQVVQALVSDQVGLFGGIVAAVAVAFAVKPLERFAHSVATKALPEGPEGARGKVEVYRAAVEAAVESGGISEKERESLRRLREKLAVPPEEAAAVEASVGGIP